MAVVIAVEQRRHVDRQPGDGSLLPLENQTVSRARTEIACVRIVARPANSDVTVVSGADVLVELAVDLRLQSRDQIADV